MSELRRAATVYHELGWSPAWTAGLVWILAGRVVEAIDTPRPLGELALPLLPADVPVFEAPEDPEPRWVFLTRPAVTWLDALERLGIDHLRAGHTLDLPPSRFGPCRLTWINPPTGPLPDFTTIAEAILGTTRRRPDLCRAARAANTAHGGSPRDPGPGGSPARRSTDLEGIE